MKCDPNIPLYADPVFRTICELEEVVREITDLATAILVMDQEAVVARPTFAIARIILRRARKIEKARGKIFQLTHPSRKEWEKAGGVKKWRKQMLGPKGKTAA